MSSADKIPMTARGIEKLKKELDHLKTVERRSIAKAIAEARSFGDLSENAEYKAAKEKQRNIEARILHLESIVANVELVDVSRLVGCKVVCFGAFVKVKNEETGESFLYHIVGEHEAEIQSGLLSVRSPLARAMIGKNEGDTTEVVTPVGSREYTILSVEYSAEL